MQRLRQVGLIVAVALTALVILFPFYWIVAQSLQSSAEFTLGQARLWPKHTVWTNYSTILSQDGFGRAILNSVIISAVVTAITVVISTLAGYALARLLHRGRNAALSFFLLAGFFPLTAMIGPLFLVFRQAGLLDNYLAVVLADLVYTLPLGTWLLTGLFEQLPEELEEAALVDGCGRLQALVRIVVPLAMPSLITVGILSFVLSWNDFTFALSFLSSPNKWTAPLAMVFLGQSKYQIFYNRTDAAVVIITLPIALLVFAAQRKIVSGLTAGGLK